MELYIPSLLVLLFAGIVIFLLLPNFSSTFIGIVIIAMLVIVAYEHRYYFKDEYALSTWQESIKAGALPIVGVILTIFILGWMLNFIDSGVRTTTSGTVATRLSAPRTNMNYNTGQVRSLVRNP